MYYEINVSYYGQHLFATDHSITTKNKLSQVYNTLRYKFPEEEGYAITIVKSETNGYKLMKSIRKLARWASIHFAPYVTMDSYGTIQYSWSLTEAIDWLQYCSPHAWIVNRYDGVFGAKIVERQYTKSF